VASTAIHALITCTVDIFYVFGDVMAAHAEDKPGNYTKWTFVQMIGAGVMGFTACIVLCLAPLAFYHGSLACQNKTTNEDIRNKYARYGKNIFD
jgi:hypothetical protein